MQLADRNIKSQQFPNLIIKHPSSGLRCNIVKTYKALILQDNKVLKSANGNLNKRSFRKKSHSHINSNTTTSFANVCNQSTLPNQRNRGKLNRLELLINESSHSVLDENSNLNEYDIETYRYSDIYKPLKFIDSVEVFSKIQNKINQVNSNPKPVKDYCSNFQDSIDDINVPQGYIIDNSKNLNDFKASNCSFQTPCGIGKFHIQVIFNYFICVFY